MLHILKALERGHEARFALHQELVYKVFARRNQLFAEWVAGLMGRHGDGVAAYARDMLDHVFGETGTARLLDKAQADLARVGVVLPATRLQDKLYEIEGRACRDVLDAIVGHPVVPLARSRATGLGLGARAMNGLHAIEAAIAYAKRPAAPLEFRDLFLSMVGTRPAAPAE